VVNWGLSAACPDVNAVASVLRVAGSDLRVVVHTAGPGTEDAQELALLTALGTGHPSAQGHCIVRDGRLTCGYRAGTDRVVI
jgi:hypothetical protein